MENLWTPLYWHLHYNLYPALPTSMIAPCERAIDYARHGEWDKRVRLPKGITFNGKHTMSVRDMVEANQLGFWVEG